MIWVRPGDAASAGPYFSVRERSLGYHDQRFRSHLSQICSGMHEGNMRVQAAEDGGGIERLRLILEMSGADWNSVRANN